MKKTIDLTFPTNDIAEATADCIDEMLRIDAEASVTWRQIARHLRAGETRRALELLDKVRQASADAASHATIAAQAIFILHCAQRLDPDKATGEDLEHLINMTTPPHAKDPDGGN